jgi:hypothetical protein
MIKNGEIQMVINTSEEKRQSISDSRAIRVTALAQRVTYYTHDRRRARRGRGHAAPWRG